MEIKENFLLEKNLAKYYCKFCHFKCSQKCDWNRHLLTSKHIIRSQGNTLEIKKLEKTFFCGCGKKFKTNSGLWKHQSKSNCCKQIEKGFDNGSPNMFKEIDKDELIITLLKQNADLIKGQQDMIIKLTENGIMNNSNNTTHTNSHNKAFNLNFFLNETCKNAMNITDFVDSIKLQLTDLTDIGELGYVEGISKIIVKNLNSLDETERPIHCTDKKRETMYIKDEDKWEKEDDKKTKLKKVVKTIANKNIRLLPQFREKYPDYENSNSKTSDTYDKIVIESMTTDDVKNEKIIKNISNVTIIKDKGL
jgi:hypothetical protein